MSKPLMLITADWHVRKWDRVWYRRDSLYGDTAWGIEQVEKLAEKYAPLHILLLGDIFDQKLQQADVLLTMREALDTFAARAQDVWYIQGQHEKSSPPVLRGLHGWPKHIDGQVVPIGCTDTKLYGLDYCHPLDVEDKLRSVPADIGILATHQVWREFMGEDRGDAWSYWVPAECMILTGDYHKSVIRKAGKHTLVSPGPLCMQNIGEEPGKGVLMLDDEFKLTRYPLRSRGYYSARIHNNNELVQFLDEWKDHPARKPQAGVPGHISTNLLRVWYSADLEDAQRLLEQKVGADAHLFLSQIPVQVPEMTADAARRQAAIMQNGLEGCIREFYADDQEVLADAIRLVRSQDVKSEIRSIIKERLHGTDSNGKGALQESPA